ncbi:MAG: type III sulfide quinone reductase, selenoprotein subtype [Spirochaetota bacterium]
MEKVVILGAGTGGCIMANRLLKQAKRSELAITVIDPAQQHLYQPGLLFLPFGQTTEKKILRPNRRFFSRGVSLIEQPVQSLDASARSVTLGDGSVIHYDVLIIATGTKTAPEETEGLMGEGWYTNRFDFYTLEGSRRLAAALKNFAGGHLVINIVDMPIKCPVAPLEFAFLADAYFKKRGIRDKVRISYVTPLDAAFTKPVAAKVFGDFLLHKGIEIVPEFNTGRVEGNQLISWDERTVDFDLLVSVPLHSGADFLKGNDIADDLGFVRVNKATLQSEKYPEIFSLGDATNVPTSKAGAVAHFEAESLSDNILRYIRKEPLQADFDGHANCFIETGHGKATLIDFSYDTEPLPGKFPYAGIGPLKLLKETRMNHWGKLAFRLIYWYILLPARWLPIGRHFSMKGKYRPT